MYPEDVSVHLRAATGLMIPAHCQPLMFTVIQITCCSIFTDNVQHVYRIWLS